MSKDIIKHGEDAALVEGCFFSKDETRILTREFYQNGRSVCKIDGRMVPLSELKALGEELIDIHGQHDNQSLLNEKTHLNLLDSFCEKDIASILQEYEAALSEYKNIKAKIKEGYGEPLERARRIDLLKYQKNEIEVAQLKEDEEEDLNNIRNIVLNSEKIAKSLNSAYSLIYDNVLENIGVTTKELSGISHIDSKYEKLLQTVNDAYYSLNDVASEVAECLTEVDFDEEKQREIEERLDIIFSLKRKYGNTVNKVLEYLKNITEELNFLENSEEIIKKLELEKKQKEEKLKDLALKIRKIRKEYSKIIENQVNKELKELEMKKAYIEFKFDESEEFLETGLDIVQIMICTNSGEGVKPLSKIASGGEISRVMLST